MAGSNAFASRGWADHDDTAPSLTRRPRRMILASSARPRIRCQSPRAGCRGGSGPLLKTAIYCHLSPQNRYDRFCTHSISSPFLGVPASPGPGLRTVSGTNRTLGESLSPRAICRMIGERADKSENVSISARLPRRNRSARFGAGIPGNPVSLDSDVNDRSNATRDDAGRVTSAVRFHAD